MSWPTWLSLGCPAFALGLLALNAYERRRFKNRNPYSLLSDEEWRELKAERRRDAEAA